MTAGAACPKAEEDKSSSEHSSAEGRGHVSEASLALEPWLELGGHLPFNISIFFSVLCSIAHKKYTLWV